MTAVDTFTPAYRQRIATMTAQTDREEAEERRGLAPKTHRCGRCAKDATYVDRAFSGAVCYVCYACNGKGWPTIVGPK